MWVHFDRRGRYTGRTQRLTCLQVLMLPFVLLFVLLCALLPFMWPFAVLGGGWAGWTATVCWNLLLGFLFVFVLGRPGRSR